MLLPSPATDCLRRLCILPLPDSILLRVQGPKRCVETSSGRQELEKRLERGLCIQQEAEFAAVSAEASEVTVPCSGVAWALHQEVQHCFRCTVTGRAGGGVRSVDAVEVRRQWGVSRTKLDQ